MAYGVCSRTLWFIARERKRKEHGLYQTCSRPVAATLIECMHMEMCGFVRLHTFDVVTGECGQVDRGVTQNGNKKCHNGHKMSQQCIHSNNREQVCGSLQMLAGFAG